MMTDTELHEAADRALERAFRQVLSDDVRMDAHRRNRLYDMMQAELDQLAQNLFDNGEGVVRLTFDAGWSGIADRVST